MKFLPLVHWIQDTCPLLAHVTLTWCNKLNDSGWGYLETNTLSTVSNIAEWTHIIPAFHRIYRQVRGGLGFMVPERCLSRCRTRRRGLLSPESTHTG